MKKLIFILLTIYLLQIICINNDCRCQWEKVNATFGGDIVCFTTFEANLFAGTYGNGVLKSTNNGINWFTVNNGITSQNVKSFAVLGTNLFAGTWEGVFCSSNSGVNWIALNNGLSNLLVYTLAVSNNNLFAGTWGNGVYISTNSGGNWVAKNNGISNLSIWSLATSSTNIFAGTWGGAFLSTNNGTSWVAINNGLTNQNVRSIVVSGANLFAITDSAVFLSTNSGSNWTEAGLRNYYVWTLAISGSNIFAGTSGGAFLSTNNGMNWIQINQGFITTPIIYSLYIANNYIFAGINGQTVWRRLLSDFINVKNIYSEVPGEYFLNQNYPNPFNPNTIIRFKIKDSRLVTLKIYDILGKEIATLVNEKLKAGEYEVPFSISQFSNNNISSGIYFYRIEAGDFKDTKRMVLIK